MPLNDFYVGINIVVKWHVSRSQDTWTTKIAQYDLSPRDIPLSKVFQ